MNDTEGMYGAAVPASAGRGSVRGLLGAYTFVDYATQGYAALVGVLILFFHNGTVRAWPWVMAAHGAILVLVHSLVQWHRRVQPGKTLDFVRHFYPVPLYLWFFSETGWLNRMFVTDYLDPMVIRWDQAIFGAQPGVAFMQKLPYLAVSEIFYAAYFSYYIMIVGVGVALFIRDRAAFFHYISDVSFVFYVCYTIYIFLPVIGPRVFFHEINGYVLSAPLQGLASTDVYPEVVKRGLFFKVMAFLYRMFEAPGAAFPSSHVAVAFCTTFFSFRYLKPIRWVHFVTTILLCLSTVYCRYHYGVDVLAGLVTAAVLVPMGNWLYFEVEPGGIRPGKRARVVSKTS